MTFEQERRAASMTLAPYDSVGTKRPSITST